MEEFLDMEEIYQERARYLLNIDELLEEIHSHKQYIDTTKVEFCWNTGTVCCGTLVDTDEMQVKTEN